MTNLKSFIRHFTFYFIVNLVGLGLFAFLRYSLPDPNTDSVLVDSIKKFGHLEFLIWAVLIFSFLLAFVNSFVDIVIFKKINLKLPLGLLLLIELTAQVIIVYFVWNFALEFIWHALLNIQHQTGENRKIEIYAFIIVLLFFLVGLGRLIIAIDRKLGHGNIWKIILGRFYNPKEEERVFMFIDLRGSASIAEQLGHIKFSQFIKDCFSDLTIVDKYRAEVYQFVGDEVVLTWCKPNAFKKNNYLNAFYAFRNELKRRGPYYLKKYGLEPTFKAGVHAGIVVTTEVGDLKRQICYHGDTINTASRIQGLCNELGAELLISDNVLKETTNSESHSFLDLGFGKLKGKEIEIKIHEVKEL